MAEISIGSVLFSLFSLLFGSFILYLGAEGLVRGSSSLALRMRISSLVIGLTVVSLGTSSPELIVSLLSALEGSSSIAIGNVIGSNICNVALILGLSALFSPIKMDFKEISRDIYIMLLVSIVLFLFLLDGQISMLEGAIFTIGIILYIILTIYFSRKKNIKSENPLKDIVILNKK
ncbi:MAG TPA: sodium:calcium antiporter, partial [Candidatus Kapabacteria bacterium]|nr:sodium:calcium antiporter [Candidatus Kapabacteria bacterium]